MKRLSIVFAAVLGLWALGGCDKPSEENCRKALLNMQSLLGTDTLNSTSALQSEIRRCRGGSKREAVECAMKATTLEELEHCKFYKLPHTAGSDSTAGSAAGSGSAAGAGSAAGSDSGSAAAAGSDSGSAAAAGSDSGSAAAAGSAADSGSAAGSGSAAAEPGAAGTPAK